MSLRNNVFKILSLDELYFNVSKIPIEESSYPKHSAFPLYLSVGVHVPTKLTLRARRATHNYIYTPALVQILSKPDVRRNKKK